jgi:hypothetical protein
MSSYLVPSYVQQVPECASVAAILQELGHRPFNPPDTNCRGVVARIRDHRTMRAPVTIRL